MVFHKLTTSGTSRSSASDIWRQSRSSRWSRAVSGEAATPPYFERPDRNLEWQSNRNVLQGFSARSPIREFCLAEIFRASAYPQWRRVAERLHQVGAVAGLLRFRIGGFRQLQRRTLRRGDQAV